ncbi:SRPBCC domain-containing protein [Bdellovibrio sp. HCB337]|uniref:SRPBCC domain-containing protein n=1 Tax=Bdellovibrio sp. HCB337 TaxID=3394358 RepID=UPI0039A4D66B
MGKYKMSHRVENGNVLVIEREFDAPRKLVFSMFKSPEHIKQFWGPRGWDVPVCNVDFRAGGAWVYCMKCVDKNQGNFFGMEAWGRADYKEIVEPEKIVYVDAFCDANGNIDPNLPSATVTMLFVDMGNKTKIVSRGEYASPADLKVVTDMGMIQGITETWDRLEELLAKNL